MRKRAASGVQSDAGPVYADGPGTAAMDLGLTDHAVLVTASSSGMGKGCAWAFLAEGANVAICGRDPDRLDAARSDLADAGPGDVLAVHADLTVADDVVALVEETVATFGGIDHVVTSAGPPPGGPFSDLTEADWYAAYDVLVMSVVRTLDAVRSHLATSDAGTVVTLAATAAEEPNPRLVVSSSVRRAVVGLTKALSFEWAPIRLNAVLPGAHDTPRLREHAMEDVEDGTYDDLDAALVGWGDNPLDRVGDPRALGDLVAFLSSERASYITGTAIPVDGGRMRGV